MIDAIEKALTGKPVEVAVCQPPSGELDHLAAAVNALLKKVSPSSSSPATGQTSPRASGMAEERSRNLLQGMHESYFELDLQGNITFCNDRMIHKLGYTREEIAGMNFRSLLDKQNRKKIYEVSREMMQNGGVQSFEWQISTKNGQTIDTESSIAVLRDENGRPKGFHGVARDISGRKQAERDLHLSEKRYRNILDSIEESYFEVDLRGNLQFFNDAMLRDLHYTPEEIQNINFRKLVDTPTARKIFEAFHQVYLTGAPIKGFDWKINKKTGEKMDVESSIALIRDENGQPAGFRGIVRDISLRKQAEKRFRLITENIRDVIWTQDFNQNYTYLSPSIHRMTGFHPEEWTALQARTMLTSEACDLIQRTFQKHPQGHPESADDDSRQTVVFETMLPRRDGTRFWAEISVDINHDEKGAPFEMIGVTRDITERKKAEEDFKESERRYRMIVENMHESITTMDMNLNYTYQSPSEVHISGYTAEELVTIPIRDMVTPESYALIEQIMTEEFAREFSGEPVDPTRSRSFEIEVHHKNGGTIWEELTVSFNRDENEKPVEIMMVGRDATGRRKMEQALRESEKRYRMIVENIHDVVFTVNLDFQFMFISSNRPLLTGYKPEEIRLIPMDRLAPPETLAYVYREFTRAMEREKTQQQAEEPSPKTHELEVYHKNGGTIWLEVTAAFIRDGQGKPLEIIAATRDITARKRAELALEESEKRYRMIVENMHESISLLDLHLNYIYQSPSEVRITGYTPEEIMRIPSNQQVTPESYERGVAMLTEELEKEFSAKPVDSYRSRTIEMEYYHKDGGTIWQEMTVSFQRDETGKPTGLLFAGRNITDRKKAEAEKEKLENQLLQSQKLETVGRLAGGVAHDFNNMLNVILGYIDLVKLKLPNAHPVIQDILEIEKAACRSRDLTAQLLAFSRKQIIRPRIVNLNDLIADITKSLIRLIGEDIHLQFHPARNLWPIKFDPMQIEQILINLAVNARDAMPQGGKLLIETANVNIDSGFSAILPDSVPGPCVRLTVSDTGEGIDKDHIPHIFEPFFTTKDVGKGTGLGLATVYGIVKQNNGWINVYSEPERGTTFKIHLPRAGDPENFHETDVQPSPEHGSGTVLLVEDDEMVMKMIADMLEVMGYRVIALQDPLDAVLLAEKEETSFDLVITDVVMPGISGKELRNRLLTTRPELKVLFMSGYTADIIAHHGVLEDGVQFLQKPFSINDLAAKVSQLIPDAKTAP